MTEFIFYRIHDDWRIQFYKLLHKIYNKDYVISVQCGSESVRDSLNEYLWNYKADSFLPHGIDTGEESELSTFQPILLTVNGDNANSSTIRFFVDKALMCNDDIGNYEKIVFIVDYNDKENREWALKNLLSLKNNGYEPTIHHNASGTWKKL
ncbi:DNA polymerase III subunit chi [Candidatus Liberibacter americanus]|uniref:DNA polymerase III chi subunit n=1 Tax=Candidatus Liberibacter americanus str. Sao Paulo TaxID=1261131 RepID=U6B3M7_9HYPH|nr:DNA polymerase III subunit chi [Candidatus Liberibacter americanus]AHA27674.1 DNA polymerase III chi subunit [Candidatus Liberibacter americanus str. Sao Paulo]EMS36383.1 DNA polymerase III subunit chi [Candidatus Liberibacter americanus PW_SP]